MSTDDTTQNPEQAADLAALHAMAQAEAPAPGAASAEPADRPPADLARELAGLITMAVATLGPAFPSLKGIYTPEVTEAAAQSVAAVCHKHGWLQAGLMGRWGEEIACLVIVGPLVYQTAQGVRADLAARAKPAERIEGPNLAAPVPAPAPVQKTVTFGAMPAGEGAA
ncbi:hypothetical protein [Schlegelella aquatica]|uniref:hypothetical protein n=1 Tax=Caldimonas aquatica TaxID=376175 RepID=UPI0037518636